ncbi:MAG: DUF427 domain-containing protein [Actinobacteria bacterium]|nr:DUF427 domain-containing protein [Actinomycetota bacterium]
MADRRKLVPDSAHPITIAPTAGRVVVSRRGRVLADSTQALTLQEASYPPVQYLPLVDVDATVLERSEHSTYCPYKGVAGYFRVVTDGEVLDDVVWFYDDPYAPVAAIAGHVAFYADRVDVTVHAR